MHNRLKLDYIERFTSRFQNGLFRESLTFTIDGLNYYGKKPGLYTISRHGNSRATSFKYIKICLLNLPLLEAKQTENATILYIHVL